MHNLKTNFDKIIGIVKSISEGNLYDEGNFYSYRNKPKMSDIEIIALVLTAESLGIDSENLLFSKLRQEFMEDFPRLPDRTNYNRRRKRLQNHFAWICESVSKLISPDENQYIIDSIPVPICANPRITRVKICKEDPHLQPARSYHASHKMYYYGFKMQLVTSRSGVPISLGMTPANVHDVSYLQHLDVNQISGSELIGDKGYLSASYQTSLFENEGIQLITPLRSNMKRRENLWNPKYRYIRKRIETLFSQMCDQLYLKRNYAKTLDGLFARMCSKIGSVAILQYLNFINEKPLNRLKHALGN
ncbi:IS982 family transposase [Flavobacterium caeni]|uniref:Transposase DDE domain-containing protein n=1 Tax=Flavobacterium caeni TaxID=490189 RepID=A0A1G5KRF7_9FLAO|nr:IS982 family transposase [Flavobacterium caeni]SCZ02680.1 Transposase DDE domain-containing protein [Flavobacterium caeni]